MIIVPKIRANVLINCQATGQSLNFIYGSNVMLHTAPGDELGFEGCQILTVSVGSEPMAQFGPFTDYGIQEFEDGTVIIALIIDPDDALEDGGEDGIVSMEVSGETNLDEGPWL